jgi:hypothetical protein
MSAVNDILPSGDRMKKTLCWISEMVRSHEAQIRFDLSPKECSFIERNLADDAPPCTEEKDLS